MARRPVYLPVSSAPEPCLLSYASRADGKQSSANPTSGKVSMQEGHTDVTMMLNNIVSLDYCVRTDESTAEVDLRDLEDSKVDYRAVEYVTAYFVIFRITKASN
jgi:hypothetical protein